jgi:ankyrin repeat protein
VLESLPQSLDEHYERILLSIDELYHNFVKKVFQWLSFSSRPMHFRKLVELSTLDSELKPFAIRGQVMDLSDLTIICSTLVTLTKAPHIKYSQHQEMDQYLELAHSSVKAYLVSPRIMHSKASIYGMTERSAHASIAEDCITYLFQLDQFEKLDNHILKQYPLAKYSTQFWHRHAQIASQLGHMDQLQLLIFKLLASNRVFRHMLRIFNRLRDTFTTDFNTDDLNPLFYAAWFGLVEPVKLILRSVTKADEKMIDIYSSAFVAAAERGHLAVIQMLLKKSADIEYKKSSWSATALERAASKGHEAVVSLLLANGADPNNRGHGGSPLLKAALSGHQTIVKTLLDHGADMNIGDTILPRTPLEAAVLRGFEDIVSLLLEHSAALHTDGDSIRRALDNAAEFGPIGSVKMLLQAGGVITDTTLAAAATSGNQEIVELLIRNLEEAGSTLSDHHNGSSLIEAAEYCHEALVRLLLEKGVDVNEVAANRMEERMTALQAAARNGWESIVLLLLDNGANIDATSSGCGSALQTASLNGHTGVVKLLVKRNASLTLSDVTFGGVLQAAAWSGNTDILRLLLDHGACINAVDSVHGTALQTAAWRGMKDAAQLLIKHGANINSLNNLLGNALQAAAWRGHSDIIELLLENGANVNADSGPQGTALQAAASNGRSSWSRLFYEEGDWANQERIEDLLMLEAAKFRLWMTDDMGVFEDCVLSADCSEHIVEMLLENGADVHAKSGPFGCVLQAAAAAGDNEAVIKLLLDRGPSIKRQDGPHGSAFHAAKKFGHDRVLALLLEHQKRGPESGDQMDKVLELRQNETNNERREERQEV